MKNKLEICAGSVEDCLIAYQAGAKQVELNSALSLGGLSPSLISLKKVKKDTDLIVNCMERLRPGGFCYNDLEFKSMLDEAKMFLEHDADGIVFGFLLESFEIDEKRTKQMVNLIHSYHKKAIFHRAFDLTNDAFCSMETLIHCGVDRVLTSGLKANAMEGKELLTELQTVFGQQIEILAGCGLHKGNVAQFIQDTNIHSIHSSCKGYGIDPTTQHNDVSYAYLDDSCRYEKTDMEEVKQMIQICNSL